MNENLRDFCFLSDVSKTLPIVLFAIIRKKMELIMYNIINKKNNFASEFVVRIDKCPDLGT